MIQTEMGCMLFLILLLAAWAARACLLGLHGLLAALGRVPKRAPPGPPSSQAHSLGQPDHGCCWLHPIRMRNAIWHPIRMAFEIWHPHANSFDSRNFSLFSLLLHFAAHFHCIETWRDNFTPALSFSPWDPIGPASPVRISFSRQE